MRSDVGERLFVQSASGLIWRFEKTPAGFGRYFFLVETSTVSCFLL